MTRYLVTGLTAYRGHQPGEEFDADIDEDEEDLAIARGAVEVVSGAKKPKAKENTDA